MSPGLLKVRERAKRDPDARFNSLAHLLDQKALERAYGRIRKSAAVGVDDVTKEQYGHDLEINIHTEIMGMMEVWRCCIAHITLIPNIPLL